MAAIRFFRLSRQRAEVRVEHLDPILLPVVQAADFKVQLGLVRARQPERVQMSMRAAQTPELISKPMLAAAAAGLVPPGAIARQTQLVTVEVGSYPASVVQLLLTRVAAALAGTTAGLVIPPQALEDRVVEGPGGLLVAALVLMVSSTLDPVGVEDQAV